MNITGRAAWGALPARPGVQTIDMSKRTGFMVHHSAGPADQSLAAIQHWCMTGRGFLDIDYNFLIRGTTGEVYEGRGWTAVGSHCVGRNSEDLGVCIIGHDEFTDAAKQSLEDLYQEAVRRAGHHLVVLGHRDAWKTDCPGDVIYGWVHAGHLNPAARTLQLAHPWMRGDDVKAVQEKVDTPRDGIYGPATAAAVKHYQSIRGLQADGIVGPLTRAAMGL